MSLIAATPPVLRRLSSAPLLSYGFRPFFLGAGVWAAVAMLLWLAAMAGHLRLAAGYGAAAWHAHELLFGYGAAAMAGFVLTASPNWTGRPPIAGWPLLGLFVLWLAGRLALLDFDRLGAAAAAIDALFLVALALVFGREIVAARNWRNLRIVLLIAAVAASNVLFHLEVIATGSPDLSLRIGLSFIVALLMVIGGRITPSFTRNSLISVKARHYPPLFDRLEAASVAIAVASLVLWVLMPGRLWTGLALLAAGAAQAMRLARWRGMATWREPLVLVLHIGYAFIPLGFLAAALSDLRPDILPPTAALHAWTAGAIGVMTLGVMTRVSLGHTGHPVTASWATTAVYAAVVLAAALRIIAPVFAIANTLLAASAIAWSLAFAGFVAAYAPLLILRSEGPRGC